MTPSIVTGSDERAREVVGADHRAHGIFDQWDRHPDAPAYWFRLPSWVQQYATECVAATERLAASRPTDAGAGEEQARALLAREMPQQDWDKLRTAILSGSTAFHSDPLSWVVEAAVRAIAAALATPKPPVDEAMREVDLLEQAARVAEEDRTPAYGPHRADMEALADIQRRNIAAAIRALSTRNLTGDGGGA